ncbi:MAG TPA: DNA-protecting protein DprA [Candidatus Merdenecus merdavium]|nr:DNA-protecting protein DprA [Candidatus Merdenecus merdavium]
MKEYYWYWLHNIPGIFRKKIFLLWEYYGSVKEIYEAGEKEIDTLPFLKDQDKKNLIRSRNTWDLKREYEQLEKKGVQFISIEHPLYPEKLKCIYDYPLGLYLRGGMPDPSKPCISIVGARACSNYGKSMTKEIVEALVENHVQIVSGLALGIDGIAQEHTIACGGKTFGILGCGIDICYPKQNFNTYMKMLHSGGIISEFPIGTPPLARNFPMRNRIISGLSDTLIIIEAKEKSGSLITADMALEQGKDIYALPGRVGDTLSYGCNQLIKQGAGIITSIEDLLENLGIFNKNNGKIVKNKKDLLETMEEMVYSCLDFQPKSLHSIFYEVPLTFDEVLSNLLTLELKGYIVETGKNYYAKVK